MASKRVRIGLREIRDLPSDCFLWDTALPGFYARRQKSQAITYSVFLRNDAGRQRWVKIGRHGAPWTPDTAREEARRVLGLAAAGRDPQAEKQARRHPTMMADLCDFYWQEAIAGRLLVRGGRGKKLSTLASDHGRIEGHIKPLLGKLAVTAVTRPDVERAMHAIAEGKTAKRAKTKKLRGLSNVRGGKGVSSRTMGLLGAIFTFAIRHGFRVDNPVRGIQKFADGIRQRRLSDDEHRLLAEALRAAETANRLWLPGLAAIRFLALTGWRSGEALNLRWSDLDLEKRTATLPDSKTGRSMRPLSLAARDLIQAQPRINSAELVFPASRGHGLMSGFRGIWNRLVRPTGMPSDITPHVLRHSFVSLAADLGYSEPTIAALIGHRGHTITSRYIHSADAVLLTAADAIARNILGLMNESYSSAKILPPTPWAAS